MELIKSYFPELSQKQYGQLEKLLPLYQEWNAQINVISRKDIDELYTRHVLHSLGIAKVIQFKPSTTILDVGTGGGFPGIPLAILFPESDFHLVDSIGKKIKVVNEVASALGLENLTASHQRVEKVSGTYDFVVSRAVTRMKPFIHWVHQKIKTEGNNDLANGILYLKGGDLAEEMKEVKRPWSEYLLTNYFSDPFFETKKVIYVPFG
ncbi:MAG: 16S rRNA (guanine(527)-N(7))-methyltransferase RsmG [Cyclobacteriaceae bacterium]